MIFSLIHLWRCEHDRIPDLHYSPRGSHSFAGILEGRKACLPHCSNDPTQNYWYLELGGNRDTIHETEEIKDELIALAMGAWDHIKNSGQEDNDNWELEFLGFLPGKRESRRMCGEYIITQTDSSNIPRM